MYMSLIRASMLEARPGSGGNRRGVDTLAAVTSAAEQPQQDELDRPSGVDDCGADVWADRSLRLQDVERIGPGVERGMKEENKQQASPAAVVEPGRNDGERDRAHHEQAKR